MAPPSYLCLSPEAELTHKRWVGLQLLEDLSAMTYFRTGLWGVGYVRSSGWMWDTYWTETPPPPEYWDERMRISCFCFLSHQNRDLHITGVKTHTG